MTFSKVFSVACFCIFSLFYTLSFSQGQGDPVKMTPLQHYAVQLTNGVAENNKTTDNLTPNDLTNLPVGIVREIGNHQYVVAIDSAYWDNGTGWFFNAYASIKFPGTSTPVAFSAKKIGFNKGGLASLSQTKLVLIAAQWIRISDNVMLELPADGSNYVEFGCEGFRSVNLSGRFHFTGLIEPVADSARNVTASFQAHISDLSNIMTTVKIDPFRIRNLADVTFEVKNAVVDLSDYANPAGFSFPADYQQSFDDSPNLWQGFYLEQVDIKINTFGGSAAEGNSKWLTIQGSNILIDGDGVTGKVSGTNVLPLLNGSVDGWNISVETISLDLLRNNLSGGSLAGQLKVPFLGGDPFAYTGEIALQEDELNYKFLINTPGDKEYTTPFSSDEAGVAIRVKQGSTIAVEKMEGEFRASALLHGAFFIKGGKLNAKGIEFQNLALSSRAPYIKAPDFSLTVMDPSTMGFPIYLEKISLTTSQEGKIVLGTDFGLNFTDDQSKGFSAKAHIDLIARRKEEADLDGVTRKQEWVYEAVKFGDINMECNTTALSVKGRLSIMENDPVYGNGFRGSLSMSVKNVLEGLHVNGYFGRTIKDGKDGFRYWHLDAYMPLGPTGIPIPPGLLSLRGIIGGASYKMAPANYTAPDYSKLDAGAQDQGGTSSPEVSSGMQYVPDAKAGISFTAGVTLALASNAEAFNGDAELTVAFNDSWGLRYVQFKGSAYFMTSIEERGRRTGSEPVNAPFYADLNVMYDNVNSTFHANMKAYLNIKDKFRGTGPDNMAGEMVMHFGKGEHYVWIGRPAQMLGVDIANLAVAQGYFMTGSKIESAPPLPREVREIADDLGARDENGLATSRGFALGARFQAGYDSKKSLSPFHVSMTFGAGLDVMLRDFGDATCAGSSEPIGFNGGWYASGQAYAFMRGKVGIKRFNILNLGAAAVLAFKGPNPTWLKGQLAGRYSVMGGLVKGKFNMKLIIGEECEIVSNSGSELGEVLVIQDITPPAGNDVSVFTSPQVSFNTSIDTEFAMMNTNDETNSYRVRFDKFAVTSNGQPIQATPQWNAGKDVLALTLLETLPPRVTITATAQVHWEKKLPNGSWEPLRDNNNAVTYETKEITFTTGEAPTFIPDENVSYSYPVKHQYNFLVNEHGQGYVKLRTGQAYLFQPSDDGTKWAYLARFEQPSGNKTEVPISYDDGKATVNFAIPSELTRQVVYKLTFIKVPEAQASVDANVKRTSVNVEGVGEDNEVSVASNTLEGNLTQKIEKEIYSSAFRTSRFATFSEKWASLSGARNLFDVAVGNVALIGKDAMLQETFDEFELNGFQNHHQALVQMSASPDDSWMANTMSPMLYNTYPLHPSVTITHRNPDSLGVRPLRAVRLYNMQEDYLLDENNISSGVAPTKSGQMKVMYFLSYIGFRDYNDLRNKAARQVLAGNGSAGISRLLSVVGYTDLTPGTYRINFSYTLPGNQVTTEKQMEIQF